MTPKTLAYRLLGLVASTLLLAGCVTVGDDAKPTSPGAKPAVKAPTVGTSAASPASRDRISLVFIPILRSKPSQIQLLAMQKGAPVSAGTLTIQDKSVARNIGDRLRPENAAATVTRYQDALVKHARVASAEVKKALNDPSLAKHPRCDVATVKQQRAGNKVSFTLMEGSDEEETICFILPRDRSSAKDIRRLLSLGVAAGIKAPLLAKLETGVSLEPDPDISPTATEEQMVLRPFYVGHAAGGARQFNSTAAFINDTFPQATLRQKVAALAQAVQNLNTIEVERTSEGRLTPFTSPAAVLLDQKGASDAKAVLLASLILAIDRDAKIVLAEIDGIYVLGVAMEKNSGDWIIDPGGKAAGNTPPFVLVDPNWLTEPGRSIAPVLKGPMVDGVLSQDEIDILYTLYGFGGTKSRSTTKRGTDT